MDALQLEFLGRAKEYCDYEVCAVFIGGGTPSLVEPLSIKRLLDFVRERMQLAETAEITIEVNPGTVDREKLLCYREAGINRLSIGLQSALEEELICLGRIHSWKQFLDTYEMATEVGFTNINVDIMSAIPGQTLERFGETLRRVCGLTPPPKHLSVYSLIVEEGTEFYKWQGENRLELPDEETERAMYHETARYLENLGYQRYEISNYAIPGWECRHNCGYWTGREYIGFGIGAASLFRHTRFRNTEALLHYLKSPLDCREDIHVLSTQEEMEEFLFLGLRLCKGVDKDKFKQRFSVELGSVYQEVIDRNVSDGLLLEDENCVYLTERGLDLSNYVMAQFLL